MSGTTVRNLQVFQKLCGFDNSDFAQRILFITMMWDLPDPPEEGDNRLKELCDKWWAPMMKKGARHIALRRPKDARPINTIVHSIAEEIINSTSQTTLKIQSQIRGLVESGDIVILSVSTLKSILAC